ncbi:hypothetical protein [Anaplasma phagocytophilum]|uniref:hypothetical protein n=1 Tax=Anaplasma phagocytophilum TaxID=948 RepID=UPI00201A61DB
MFTLLRLLKSLTLSSIPRFVVESMRRFPLADRRQRTMQRRGIRTLKQLSAVALGLVERREDMVL